MKILRILNKNAIFVKDRDGEKIIYGLGIAFQKKKNDQVDPSRIEKIFVIKDQSEHQQFEEILPTLPEEYIQVSEVEERLRIEIPEVLTLSPVRDSERQVAVSAIYKDISEKKQAERAHHRMHQQLQEDEINYRTIFQQAVDAIYLLELNEERIPTRHLEVNPVGCERLGYSREELISMPLSDLFSLRSSLFIRLVNELRVGKSSFMIEDEYISKTGKTRHAELSFRVFHLGEKEVLLAISRDIAERLQTEELLRKAEKLAVVRQLAAGIAHEIRNPLTTLKGFIQLLKSTTNENWQWYVDVMVSEIERLEFISNEFMTIDNPQVTHFQLHDLRLLVEQLTTLLEPQARMNQVHIRMEFGCDLPLIPCEGNQLKHVFTHILKNAIEAMPMGGEILVQVHPFDQDQIFIRFIDHGCGIPPERIPHLGEPFYSLKEKGIGLGLMMCYKIVEEHRGKIVIDSKMDQGTIVDVILPIHPTYHQEVELKNEEI